MFGRSKPSPQPRSDAGGDHPGIEALETAVEALQGRLAGVEQLSGSEALKAHDTRSVVESHTARLEELLFAVSEGIQKVERTENRIRATVRRAKEQLEDGGVSSPALDAEASELRLLDGGARETEQVPSVPERVATPDMTDFPGDWSPEDLALLGAG